MGRWFPLQANDPQFPLVHCKNLLTFTSMAGCSKPPSKQPHPLSAAWSWRAEGELFSSVLYNLCINLIPAPPHHLKIDLYAVLIAIITKFPQISATP